MMSAFVFAESTLPHMDIIMASRPSKTADSVSLPSTKRLDSHFINGRNLFMVIFHIAHGKTPTAEEHDILMGDDM